MGKLNEWFDEKINVLTAWHTTRHIICLQNSYLLFSSTFFSFCSNLTGLLFIIANINHIVKKKFKDVKNQKGLWNLHQSWENHAKFLAFTIFFHILSVPLKKTSKYLWQQSLTHPTIQMCRGNVNSLIQWIWSSSCTSNNWLAGIKQLMDPLWCTA